MEAVMPAALDCVDLTRRLIRCPSITPVEVGALDLVQQVLEDFGFACHRLMFTEAGTEAVDNLYARLGEVFEVKRQTYEEWLETRGDRQK